jgi:hypothetical protein
MQHLIRSRGSRVAEVRLTFAHRAEIRPSATSAPAAPATRTEPRRRRGPWRGPGDGGYTLDEVEAVCALVRSTDPEADPAVLRWLPDSMLVPEGPAADAVVVIATDGPAPVCLEPRPRPSHGCVVAVDRDQLAHQRDRPSRSSGLPSLSGSAVHTAPARMERSESRFGPGSPWARNGVAPIVTLVSRMVLRVALQTALLTASRG